MALEWLAMQFQGRAADHWVRVVGAARVTATTDDPSFIVLTETKFSFRCIPVWDRYSPHRTRVEKKTHVIMLSP